MAYLKTDSGDQLTTDSGDFLVTDTGTTPTTTALSASPSSPQIFGTSVTLTATVTPSAATGTVGFYDGGSLIGSGTLSGGVATFTSTFGVATHSFTASYGGDSSYDASTSSALSYSITAASTSTALSASPPSTAAAGVLVTFIATVTPSAATGTVNFYDGASLIGSGTLSAGTATFVTSSLSVATHSITATYVGSTNYTTSTSSALSYTISPSVSTSTSTALSASPPPPVVHATMVVFTAIVTSSGSAATGTVEFRDGGVLLGTGTLSGTTATYSTNALDVGAHSLTATYLGDGTYTGSTSSALTYTIVTPAELPPQQPQPRGRMVGGRSRPLYVRARLLRKKKKELEEIVGSLDSISTAPPPPVTAPPPSPQPQLYRSLMDGLPPSAPQITVKSPQKRPASPPPQGDDDEDELAQILGAIL